MDAYWIWGCYCEIFCVDRVMVYSVLPWISKWWCILCKYSNFVLWNLFIHHWVLEQSVDQYCGVHRCLLVPCRLCTRTVGLDYFNRNNYLLAVILWGSRQKSTLLSLILWGWRQRNSPLPSVTKSADGKRAFLCRLLLNRLTAKHQFGWRQSTLCRLSLCRHSLPAKSLPSVFQPLPSVLARRQTVWFL